LKRALKLPAASAATRSVALCAAPIGVMSVYSYLSAVSMGSQGVEDTECSEHDVLTSANRADTVVKI